MRTHLESFVLIIPWGFPGIFPHVKGFRDSKRMGATAARHYRKFFTVGQHQNVTNSCMKLPIVQQACSLPIHEEVKALHSAGNLRPQVRAAH